MVHQGLRHPIQGGARRQVLQPRDGRLRAQRRAIFRPAPERHLEHRIVAQRVAIGVAGHDCQHAEPDDLAQRMFDLRRVARVLQAAGQPVGQVQAVFDLPEHQKATIKGHGATVEPDIERLGAER